MMAVPPSKSWTHGGSSPKRRSSPTVLTSKTNNPPSFRCRAARSMSDAQDITSIRWLIESKTQRMTSNLRPRSKAAMSPSTIVAPGTFRAATANISGDWSSPVSAASVVRRARIDPVPHPSSSTEDASGRNRAMAASTRSARGPGSSMTTS